MKFKPVLLAVSVLAIAASSAQAEPKSGFAVFVGGTGHVSRGDYHSGPAAGKSLDERSAGVSVGVEYQAAIRDGLSLYPMLQSSAESLSGSETTADLAGHAIIAVGLRYHFAGGTDGEAFLGGHVGAYSETFSYDTGSTTTYVSASGSGAGLLGGYEWADGRLVTAQLDYFETDYTNVDQSSLGLRVHFGYRWK